MIVIRNVAASISFADLRRRTPSLLTHRQKSLTTDFYDLTVKSIDGAEYGRLARSIMVNISLISVLRTSVLVKERCCYLGAGQCSRSRDI